MSNIWSEKWGIKEITSMSVLYVFVVPSGHCLYVSVQGRPVGDVFKVVQDEIENAGSESELRFCV